MDCLSASLRKGIMSRFIALSALVVGLLLAFAPGSRAQEIPQMHVLALQSTLGRPGDAGVRFHTHILMESVQASSGANAIVQNSVGVPFGGFAFETPASLACVYRLVPFVPFCNPNVVTTNPSGGSKLIAIVD